MFKQIVLLKRRPDLTMEQFIDYYENHHSKIGERIMPLARRYVRRYVRPEINPITQKAAELNFDVILEIWWDSREDFDETMKKIGQADLSKEILADEENLFASHDHPVFAVEERESEMIRPLAQVDD